MTFAIYDEKTVVLRSKPSTLLLPAVSFWKNFRLQELCPTGCSLDASFDFTISNGTSYGPVELVAADVIVDEPHSKHGMWETLWNLC